MNGARFLKSALRSFVEWNRRVSQWLCRLAGRWTGRRSGMQEFTETVLPGRLQPGMRVLDVGGGKRPSIDAETKDRLNLYVVGLDISNDELAQAPIGAYDEVIVGDVTSVEIAGEFDLVFSKAVLEHIPDNRAAIANLSRAMADGGLMAHYMPCRRAGFALINRLLGNRWAKTVLFSIYPVENRSPDFTSYQNSGFPAYYDHCVPSELQSLCEECGLEVAEVRPYFATEYFRFLVPLYTVELLRQLVLMGLGADDWAETMTIVAGKPVREVERVDAEAA